MLIGGSRLRSDFFFFFLLILAIWHLFEEFASRFKLFHIFLINKKNYIIPLFIEKRKKKTAIDVEDKNKTTVLIFKARETKILTI